MSENFKIWLILMLVGISLLSFLPQVMIFPALGYEGWVLKVSQQFDYYIWKLLKSCVFTGSHLQSKSAGLSCLRGSRGESHSGKERASSGFHLALLMGPPAGFHWIEMRDYTPWTTLWHQVGNQEMRGLGYLKGYK